MRTYPRRLQAFAAVLASLAGFVDALAFLQLGGFFVSFMSGNSTRLGVSIVHGSSAAVVAGVLLLMFVGGVFIGSMVGRRAGHRQRPVVLSMVTLVLTASGVMAILGQPNPAATLLAVAMGVENAVFERDGEVRIGVTYMTGALVKLGQALASAATGGDRWSWAPHLALWVGMVAGAVAGTLVWTMIGNMAIWVAVALAALTTCLAIFLDRTLQRQG